MKISYYELLDKIKNGEYPKIQYQDEIFKWDGYDYYRFEIREELWEQKNVMEEISNF